MIQMEYNDGEVIAMIRGAAEGLTAQAMQNLLLDVGMLLSSRIIKRIDRGIDPPNAPLTVRVKNSATTLRDSGRLMSSITYHATATELIVGTNVKYAPVQQYGATITPKTAKKLAIPADASVRTLMRRHGASVSACLDGLRRAGWKIWLTEGAIMGAPPKGGKSKGAPVVLFIRRDSVDIPPRPFMVIDKDDVQLITDKVTNHVFSFARRRF